MVVTEISIIHHVGIVLLLLWLLSFFDCCHPIVYLLSLLYLWLVHERFTLRLRRKLKFEERKAANQRRVLTDSETVRWLNYALEKMWPVCMEQIISQRIFLPIIPWFLEKYKPWTVKKVSVQHLYLGRTPPQFTEIRVLRESSDDDHMVLELGLNFLTADDMSAILVAKLKKRLGFGMATKLHLTSMHVEGKVLVGVKFLRSWPFIGRLRVCFAEPPYFQMIVKPLFSHGFDVTEVPGIAGWLDNLLATAFEETLVEPNMLVVDLEKLVSGEQENWFCVHGKEPVAHALLEVIEAADLKASDFNGLSDPYVIGRLAPYRFATQIQWKTLAPRWLEEFKVPILSWDGKCVLHIGVEDKDRFTTDDNLGKCTVNLSDLRDGQRHDMWLPLEKVKTGRVHLAITIIEANAKGKERRAEDVKIEGEKPASLPSKAAQPGPISTEPQKKPQEIADTFEEINVEGQRETGIWVHHPGSEVSQAWEPRKGKSRHIDTEILSSETPKSSKQPSDSSSSDESKDGHRTKRGNILRGIQKIFHRVNSHKHSKNEDHSNSLGVGSPHTPRSNVKARHVKRVGVKLVMGDGVSEPITPKPLQNEQEGVSIASDSSDEDSALASGSLDDDSSIGGIPVPSSFISRDANDERESEDRTLEASLYVPVGKDVDINSGSEGNKEVPIHKSLKRSP